MVRGEVSRWLHEHHWHPDEAWFVDFLKATWLVILLLLMGAMALITAILVAWPALSYLGARLFG